MNANVGAVDSGENLLLKQVEYQWEETLLGTWRRYVYPNGSLFAEFKSHGYFGPMPILHYTYGKCPETGRRIVAHGFIAIGRLARGIIAIGHASIGIIAIGQLAIGLGFGFGQAATGILAIGQLGCRRILWLRSDRHGTHCHRSGRHRWLRARPIRPRHIRVGHSPRRQRNGQGVLHAVIEDAGGERIGGAATNAILQHPVSGMVLHMRFGGARTPGLRDHLSSDDG